MSSEQHACIYIDTYRTDQEGTDTQNGHRNWHFTAVGGDGGHLAVRLQCAARERACARGAETKLELDSDARGGRHGGQNVNVYAHFSPAFSKRPRERFCHRGAVP